MKDGDKIYVECACQEELIRLTLRLESDPFDEVVVSYFNKPGDIQGWCWKIRNIWRILRYGDCTQDWISIEEPKELRRFAQWLQKAAEKIHIRRRNKRLQGSNHDR